MPPIHKWWITSSSCIGSCLNDADGGLIDALSGYIEVGNANERMHCYWMRYGKGLAAGAADLEL